MEISHVYNEGMSKWTLRYKPEYKDFFRDKTITEEQAKFIIGDKHKTSVFVNISVCMDFWENLDEQTPEAKKIISELEAQVKTA